MREPPRRRRSEEDERAEGNGLPLFPLILVVIFAGLLLGGVLAHFFGAPRKPAPPAAPSLAVAPTPSPLPSVLPSAVASRSPRVVRAPSPRPSPRLQVRRSAQPSPAPSARPSHVASPKAKAAAPKAVPTAAASSVPSAASVKPVRVRAVATRAPKPFVPVTPAAVASTKPKASAAPPAVPASPVSNYAPASAPAAASVVRSYLGAIARGDRATATSYLAHGLPGEGFMDPSSRIESVRSTSTGLQRYKVTADVLTSTGEYFITFTVEPGPGGLQITDHYAIKTQ